ncbi:hypothetical protein [Cryobacterium aureum]|uniref:hypothetical protein n=1 Tax=Cryobacterium aureum TaxID=995037 RepID=UPI000CF3BAD3|nr:hypothetical protein [Cryobacterium aureum]
MTTTATLHGRDLHIQIDGIAEPFIIKPLGGRRGQALTDLFVQIVASERPGSEMEAVLAEAVGFDVYERVQNDLSLNEGQNVLLPSFYWQTVLGLDGVNAYLSGGEGMAGAKKALLLLTMSLGISPTQTAPSTALEHLIRLQAPIRPTAASTTTVDKLPAAKRSRKPKQSTTTPEASPL